MDQNAYNRFEYLQNLILTFSYVHVSLHYFSCAYLHPSCQAMPFVIIYNCSNIYKRVNSHFNRIFFLILHHHNACNHQIEFVSKKLTNTGGVARIRMYRVNNSYYNRIRNLVIISTNTSKTNNRNHK